jgi:uncharacterized membrane protein HdeD (DUF308 family)
MTATLATGLTRVPRWFLILFGVLSLVAGILAFSWPGITVLVLISLLGIHLIFYGVLAIASSFAAGEGRILATIFGVLALMAGTSLWLRPLQNLPVVVAVVAAFWVVGGVIQTIAAIVSRDEGWGWQLVEGVFTLLAGVVMVIWPGVTILVMTWTAAVWMIFTGLVFIISGVKAGGGTPVPATA